MKGKLNGLGKTCWGPTSDAGRQSGVYPYLIRASALKRAANSRDGGLDGNGSAPVKTRFRAEITPCYSSSSLANDRASAVPSFCSPANSRFSLLLISLRSSRDAFRRYGPIESSSPIAPLDPCERVVAEDVCAPQFNTELYQANRSRLGTQADVRDVVMQPFLFLVSVAHRVLVSFRQAALSSNDPVAVA
ncbi:hypothetical protein NHF48_002145 [Sphingomonas sp. H160509]|uniref:hypothetical protein n=1 Tax=Sphingomonas sp. H160509 TaxID=2955313 RepID=UPI0020980249|nr:hypothetical protein [Sphingomonas sp. H160509]MDD1450019.1 hypothetical protein [Sphingomonas sp. H160509]